MIALYELGRQIAAGVCDHGACETCGDEGPVFIDNNRCEECDGHYYFCLICKEEQHRDDLCRHLFEDSAYEWQGSGTGRIDPTLKKPLFELFRLMPEGFAVDLRAAIKSGKFYTWASMGLIGGGSLRLYGMPDRDVWTEHWWGRAMYDLGTGENAEELADAYHWLASLYQRKTMKANRVTVKWIDEWFIRRQKPDVIRKGRKR